MVVGFTVVGIVTSLTTNATGSWLPLHLFLVGGLLSAMSATTQLLAVTWSASPPPAALAAGTQRWGLALGAVALVVGRETTRPWLAQLGAAAVLAAVAAMVPILWSIRLGATTPRFRPAIDAYMAAPRDRRVRTDPGRFAGISRTGAARWRTPPADRGVRHHRLVAIVGRRQHRRGGSVAGRPPSEGATASSL